MNGHVIHAIQQYETLGHDTEQHFGSPQCNGDWTFGTVDKSHGWYDDDGSNIQSHVADLWCIDCPSGCPRALVNRDVLGTIAGENGSAVLSNHAFRQHRIPEGGTVTRSSLDGAIWQLPATVGDAMWHPRRVRLITAWSEFTDILTEISRDHEQGIRLQTYGIREQFLGVRFATSRGSGQAEILAAIEAVWQQEIRGGSFQIHPIRPQPVDTPHDCVALIVEIWSPAIDVDFMAPVVIDTLHYQHRPRSTDGEVIQQVDYLPRHVSTQDFFNKVRLHGVCPADTYRCVIRTLHNEYVEFPGYVDVEPGFYIIVQAMPREWYQPRGGDMAFIGTFSSEAARFSTGTDDDSVFVRVYGFSLSATSLGRRSFLLTRHLYSDLDVVRSLAFELWRDVFEQNDRLLVHAPLPTILEPTESVNLILGPIPPCHLVPILASIFTSQTNDAENYLEHGPYAVVVPRDAPFETFRRSFWNSAGQQILPAPGRVWCENRYFDFNEELPLEVGTHLLVYDASTESDESSTYTEWSDEETSVASATVKLHIKKSLWPMMIPAFSMSASSLAGGIIGIGILTMWWTPDVLSRPIMQRFPEDTLVQEPVPWIRPLPDNIWQVVEDRGPRTVFPSYDDLRTDLRAARVQVQQSAILDTYGLLEHSIGLRRIVVPDLDQRTITMAVHQRWQDYSFEYNILLRYVRPQPQPLVMPQPTVSLIVQVLDPLRLPAANMVALLLDQKTALDLEETRQATTVRLAEYVRSPGLGEDVVAAVRLGGSCQPQGLRPCHIVWRSIRRAVDDEIAARPGEYLIVVAGSLEAHFRDSGVYFHRARRFGLEAQRMMRQVFNTHKIEVDVHAIGSDNVPYGARTMELTIPLLIQPRTIWTMATRLWSDRFARPGSKLFFVEPQPGLTRRPNDDLLHLLLVIDGESMEDQIPVLFGLDLVSDTTTEHAAFCPRLCRSPINEDALLRASTYHRLARVLDGQFAIYSGYRQVGNDDTVELSPGMFLVVQIHHRSRHQILHQLLDRLDRESSSEGSSNEPDDLMDGAARTQALVPNWFIISCLQGLAFRNWRRHAIMMGLTMGTLMITTYQVAVDTGFQTAEVADSYRRNIGCRVGQGMITRIGRYTEVYLRSATVPEEPLQLGRISTYSDVALFSNHTFSLQYDLTERSEWNLGCLELCCHSTSECRYDFVHRLIEFGGQPFGGSSGIQSSMCVYTWSSYIFRRHNVDCCILPDWEVDALASQRYGLYGDIDILGIIIFISNFQRLPPPGNGSHFDLNKMDDVVSFGPFSMIVDYRDNRETPTVRYGNSESGVEVPAEAHSTFMSLIHGPCRSRDVDEIPDLPWHEATQQLLDQRATTAQMPIDDHIYVYTDGSAGMLYDQQRYEYYPWASWAFAIWWKQSDGWRLLATDHGHVTQDPADKGWTGALRLTSAEGERAAIMAAVTCLLRSGIRGRIGFYFDAVSAGYGAGGIWSIPTDAKDARLLRATVQLLEHVCGSQIAYVHVKAHTGDPMNEHVNSLAYAAYGNATINQVLDFDVRPALFGARMLCESWILLAMAADNDCRYPGWESADCSLSWDTKTYEPRPDIVWGSSRDDGHLEVLDVYLRVATFNVRTLGDGVGLAAFLRRQLSALKVDIICLQETRARETRILFSQDYIRFISAAVEGHGGTEIWISRHSAAKHTQIQSSNCVVLEANHQWLVVQIRIERTYLHVVSAHAPHSGYNKADTDQWWRCFTNMLMQKVGTQPVILGIDANTHFDVPVEGAIGDFGLEAASNYSANGFSTLLLDLGLWVPSTYRQHHFGTTATWRHPATGSWHRNDYIAISHCLQVSWCQSWVEGNIDCGGANIDHLPGIVDCSFILPKGNRSQRPPRIDTLAMRNADPERLSQLLANIPDFPWQLNVHEHATLLNQALLAALAATFPCTRKPPLREYISQEAWHLRAQRKRVRRRLYNRHDIVKYNDLAAAFYALKGQRSYLAMRAEGLNWELACVLADMADRLQLRKHNLQLKRQLREDRDRYCQDIAAEADRAPPSQTFQRLRALGVMGKNRRKSARAMVTMRDEQGNEVLSMDDLNDLWRRHFEGLEDGFTIAKEELLRRCHQTQCNRDIPQMAFTEIPSLCDLEKALRANKWCKSAIFDNLPTDACHKFPQLIALVAYTPSLSNRHSLWLSPWGIRGAYSSTRTRGVDQRINVELIAP